VVKAKVAVMLVAVVKVTAAAKAAVADVGNFKEISFSRAKGEIGSLRFLPWRLTPSQLILTAFTFLISLLICSGNATAYEEYVSGKYTKRKADYSPPTGSGYQKKILNEMRAVTGGFEGAQGYPAPSQGGYNKTKSNHMDPREFLGMYEQAMRQQDQAMQQMGMEAIYGEALDYGSGAGYGGSYGSATKTSKAMKTKNNPMASKFFGKNR
jgi:hypothetical protein